MFSLVNNSAKSTKMYTVRAKVSCTSFFKLNVQKGKEN